MKNILNRKKSYVIFLILYTVSILTWVFIDDDFIGLRWLSFYNLAIATPFLLADIYSWRNESLENLKKENLFFKYKIIFLTLGLSLCMHLPQKIAILFYDLNSLVQNIEVMQATKSSNSLNFNRFSGGSFTTMANAKDEKDVSPVACNLLTKHKCEYNIVLNGDKPIIEYKDNLGYPFKNYKLIFSIESNTINKDIDYHLNLYKKNKIYVIFYLIFVQSASIVLIFFAYRILWQHIIHQENLSNKELFL